MDTGLGLDLSLLKIEIIYGVWPSLVGCFIWDEDVVGSSPATPTIARSLKEKHSIPEWENYTVLPASIE